MMRSHVPGSVGTAASSSGRSSGSSGQRSVTARSSWRVSAEVIVQPGCGWVAGSWAAGISPYSTVRTRSERHSSTRSGAAMPTRSFEESASTEPAASACRVSA